MSSIPTYTRKPLPSAIYLNDPNLAKKNTAGAHIDMTVMAMLSLATAQTLKSMGKVKDDKTGGHHKKDKSSFINEFDQLVGKQAKVITAGSNGTDIGDFSDVQNVNNVSLTSNSPVHLSAKQLQTMLSNMQTLAKEADAVLKAMGKNNHGVSHCLAKA